MKKEISFMNEKNLKVINLLILILSFFQIIKHLFSALQSYVNIRENPLIPDYLIKYIVFPLIFILPTFGFIGYFSFRNIKKKIHNQRLMLGLLIFIFLFYLSESYIMVFIQNNLNPYG